MAKSNVVPMKLRGDRRRRQAPVPSAPPAPRPAPPPFTQEHALMTTAPTEPKMQPRARKAGAAKPKPKVRLTRRSREEGDHPGTGHWRVYFLEHLIETGRVFHHAIGGAALVENGHGGAVHLCVL